MTPLAHIMATAKPAPIRVRKPRAKPAQPTPTPAEAALRAALRQSAQGHIGTVATAVGVWPC